jgi:hypothetical protein
LPIFSALGIAHVGGDTVAPSPEEELADFLNSLPVFAQKTLWHEASMSQQENLEWMHSTIPFSEQHLGEIREKLGWRPSSPLINYEELERKFELILRRIPGKLKKYRDNVKAQRKAIGIAMVKMQKIKRGRKPNVALAQRIWALDEAGIGNRIIQKMLAQEGVNLSLDGVESYLKARRRADSK